MDSRSITGIIVCIVFYIGWTQYLQTKYPDYGKPPEQTQTADAGSANTDPQTKDAAPEKKLTLKQLKPGELAPEPQASKVEKISAQDLTFKNPQINYRFNQNQAAVESATLNEYKNQISEAERANVELVDHMLSIQPSADPKRSELLTGFSAKREGNQIKFWKQDGDWLLSYQFDPDDSGYGGNLVAEYQNTSSAPKELDATLIMNETVELQESEGSFIPMARQFHSFIVGVDGSRDYENSNTYCEDEDPEPALAGVNENVDFIGFDQHYFVKVLAPEAAKYNYKIYKTQTATQAGTCSVFVRINQPQGQVKPGETVRLKFKTYFGPKKMAALASVDERLKDTMDLGWFGVIAKPLLTLVKSLNGFTGNYGIAIIVLTICLKILFYPLTRAAAVSMKRMQQYTPELTKIREKYKEDKQTQNREVMAFMSKHKINPAKGCLPILPQIPVFIAFYNVLSQSIELRDAPFFGWIHDLSIADPYYITPVLLGFGMLIQQKLTPNPTMDPTQAKVMMMMPVMFTFMMLSLPAGMVIYMITNTVVSIMQQQWLNKRLDAKLGKAANAT